MAVSRAHTSAKAADDAKLLLLNKHRRVTHLSMRSMAVPYHTVTLILPNPNVTDPGYRQNLIVIFLGPRAAPIRRIL